MTIETLKDYLSTTGMTFSYEAVLILALIDVIDHEGKTGAEQLVTEFHRFYLERKQR